MSSEESRPLVGVGVIIIRDGKILLAERKGSHGENTWASAGGHLEFGETLEECAMREAFEEFGINVNRMTFLCVSNIIAYDRHYIDFEFLGDIGTQIPKIQEQDYFTNLQWFPLSELPNPLFEPVRIAINSLLTGQSYYP